MPHSNLGKFCLWFPEARRRNDPRQAGLTKWAELSFEWLDWLCLLKEFSKLVSVFILANSNWIFPSLHPLPINTDYSKPSADCSLLQFTCPELQHFCYSGINSSFWQFCTLTWKIPWMEEPGRLQSMGSLRVRHDWVTSLSCIGEGNGNPFQCSCLENPMDGGAWWAAVHGVAKTQTQLSDFTFTFHFHALEKEMATHSSVLAWRIPGTGEPGGLPSMGLHRVRHDWSDLAAVAAFYYLNFLKCHDVAYRSLVKIKSGRKKALNGYKELTAQTRITVREWRSEWIWKTFCREN